MDITKIRFFSKNEPAVISEIEQLETEGGIILPEVYKELLLQVNGFGTYGTVVIYGTEDILERYQTLEVEEYSKGYIAIGDNSGPDVFLMKQDRDCQEILITDVGYMNALDPNGKILSFKNWVEAGYPDIREFEEFIDCI